MKIVVHNQTSHKNSLITKLLSKVFANIEENKNMQIILVEKKEIRRLNNYYRHIDAETDVLSFESDDRYSLGDVFICIDIASSQAIEYGHSFDREVAFLAVHGYLHLKGFDHQTDEEMEVMKGMQESILFAANLERK